MTPRRNSSLELLAGERQFSPRDVFLFSGTARNPGGNALATAVTAMLIEMAGETDFYPAPGFDRERGCPEEGVQIPLPESRSNGGGVLYREMANGDLVKKFAFVSQVQGPESVWLGKEVRELSVPSDGAGNWKRLFNYCCELQR